jgi:hypothetical protein
MQKKTTSERQKQNHFCRAIYRPKWFGFFFFPAKYLRRRKKNRRKKTAAKTCSHPSPVMAIWTRSEGQFAITDQPRY